MALTHRYSPTDRAARKAALAELKAEWAAAATVTALKAVLVKAFKYMGILPTA